MPVACSCDACGARFKAPDHLSGRRVKCPRCQAPFLVPLSASASWPPTDSPQSAGSQSAGSQSAGSQSAEPAKKLKTAKPVLKTRGEPAAAIPLAKKQLAPGASPTPSAGGSQAAFDAQGVSPVARHRPAGRKKKSSQQQLIVVGSLAVGAVVMIGLVGYLLTRPAGEASDSVAGDSSRTRNRAAGFHRTGHKNDSAPVSASVPAIDFQFNAENRGTLVLNWPEADRSDSIINVDGARREVASAGPLEIPLAIGQHRVVLQRRGYRPIEFKVAVEKGQEVRHDVSWQKDELAISAPKSAPGFDAWLQDFQAARARAGLVNFSSHCGLKCCAFKGGFVFGVGRVAT